MSRAIHCVPWRTVIYYPYIYSNVGNDWYFFMQWKCDDVWRLAMFPEWMLMNDVKPEMIVATDLNSAAWINDHLKPYVVRKMARKILITFE